MLKKLILFTLFAFFSQTIYAEFTGLKIETGAGLNAAAMQWYNSLTEKQNQELSDIGLSAGYQPILSSWAANFVINGIFDTEWAGFIGPLFKLDFVITGDKSYSSYPWGPRARDREAMFFVFYSGAGLRKYWGFTSMKDILKPYFGFDMGVYFMVNNYVDTIFYNPSGTVYKQTIIDLSGVFLGGNVEVGTETALFENIGIHVKTGYRFAKGNIPTYSRSTSGAENGISTVYTIDLSGLFVSAGINYFYDMKVNIPVTKIQNMTVKEEQSVKSINSLEKKEEIAGNNTAVGPIHEETKTQGVNNEPELKAKIPEINPENRLITPAATAVIVKATATQVKSSVKTQSNPAGTRDMQVKNKEQDEKAVVEIAPDMLPPIGADAKYLAFTQKGDIEFRNKNYRAALDNYKKALAEKEETSLYKRIGNCYYFLNNKIEAEKAYRKALKLKPDDNELKEFIQKLK